MVRTGFIILIFFIVIKCIENFPGGNLQSYIAGYFHFTVHGFVEILLKKQL